MTINSSKSTNDVFEQLVGVHVHGTFKSRGKLLGGPHEHSCGDAVGIGNGVTRKQHRALGALANLKFLVVEFFVHLFAKRLDRIQRGVHTGGKTLTNEDQLFGVASYPRPKGVEETARAVNVAIFL